MPSPVNRGPREVFAALIWSLHGLRAAWRIEASFRLEAVLCVIVLPLGLWLGDGPAEKALLAGCILPVPAAELLNSGIEALVDRIWPGFDPVAGRIKDMGSAAVFLLMLNVLAVWGAVLVPRAF